MSSRTHFRCPISHDKIQASRKLQTPSEKWTSEIRVCRTCNRWTRTALEPPLSLSQSEISDWNPVLIISILSSPTRFRIRTDHFSTSQDETGKENLDKGSKNHAGFNKKSPIFFYTSLLSFTAAWLNEVTDICPYFIYCNVLQSPERLLTKRRVSYPAYTSMEKISIAITEPKTYSSRTQR